MKSRIGNPQRGVSPAIITVIIIVCTTVFVFLLYTMRQNLTSREVTQRGDVSENAVLEAQVLKIAAQFSCTCGTCSGESLEQCTCKNAQEARRMIRSSILAGHPTAQILAAIDSSFGGRIERPAGEIDASQFLTAAQRTEVLSHFRCPCGKCGMENLAECECDHPRGGREVRGFIDRKLSEKQFSSTQLIAEIEKVYGGKKF